MNKVYLKYNAIASLDGLLKGVNKALIFSDKLLFLKIKDRISCDYDLCMNFDINPKKIKL